MPWIFVASVSNSQKRTLRQREFGDLKSALRWQKRHSRRTLDAPSVTRYWIDSVEAGTPFVYVASVDNVKFGTWVRRTLPELAEAKQWIRSHSCAANKTDEMPSIVRRRATALEEKELGF